MKYYDIHTHKLPESYDENVVSIYNTYPKDYTSYKDIENPNLYFSCGIHPWYLDDVESQITLLEQIIKEDRVLAIGEAGLDKVCDSDFELQEIVFRKQIEISIKINKPLIIHCVKAWDELIALYKEYKPQNTWIIHGYRGKGEQALQLMKLGMKISLGYRFNREVLEKIGFDSIFVESDDSGVFIVSICNLFVCESNIMIADFLSAVEASCRKTFKM